MHGLGIDWLATSVMPRAIYATASNKNKTQKPRLLLVYVVCVLGDSCMLMCSLHMQASGVTSNTGTAMSPISLQSATTMRVERLLANVWGMLQLEEPLVPHADSASDLAQEVRLNMLLLKTRGPDEHAVNAPCFGNIHAPLDLICYVVGELQTGADVTWQQCKSICLVHTHNLWWCSFHCSELPQVCNPAGAKL